MNSTWKFALSACALILLSACASGPITTDDNFTGTTLEQAVAANESASGQVLWGGVILSTTNLESGTLLEVLAYPLDRRQRPMTARTAKGRFLIVEERFLEPTDYADGRSITVLGALDGSTSGNIAEAKYQFPTVKAEQLHLWRPGDRYVAPRFSIGIGLEL